MKFKFPVETIREDLLVAGLLSKSGKKISSYYENIEFRINNNSLTIIATNGIMQFGAIHSILPDENVISNYYINTRQLLEALKKIKEGNIEFEFKPNTVILKHKKFKLILSIILIDTNSLIIKKDIVSILKLHFDCDEIKHLAKLTKVFNTGYLKDQRPVSRGMWIKEEDGENLLVLTNGKTLYINKLADKFPKDFHAIIPLNLLIMASIYKDDKAILNIGQNASEFMFDNRFILSLNINAKPPKLMTRINSMCESSASFKINKKEFMNGLFTVKPFSDEIDTVEILFDDINKNNITLKCQNATINLECEIIGKFPDYINMDIKILYNLINIIPEENITIFHGNDEKSLSYRSNDKNVIMLIMKYKIK